MQQKFYGVFRLLGKEKLSLYKFQWGTQAVIQLGPAALKLFALIQ
jgi:hypothetical protein